MAEQPSDSERCPNRRPAGPSHVARIPIGPNTVALRRIVECGECGAWFVGRVVPAHDVPTKRVELD